MLRAQQLPGDVTLYSDEVLHTMYHCSTELITIKQPASGSRARLTCGTVALDTEVYSWRTSVVVHLEWFFHTANSTVEPGPTWHCIPDNDFSRDKDASCPSEIALAEVGKLSRLFLLTTLFLVLGRPLYLEIAVASS